MGRASSAESEREDVDARIEEFDFELPLADRSRLTDQLVKTLLFDCTCALGVDIGAVRSAGRFPIDQHAETNRGASRSRAHHDMKVAGMESIQDPAAGLAR